MTLKKRQKLANRYSELSDLEKEALDRLRNGANLEGKDGVVAPLIKRLIELHLEGEMAGHLLVKTEQTGEMSHITTSLHLLQISPFQTMLFHSQRKISFCRSILLSDEFLSRTIIEQSFNFNSKFI